MTAGRPCILVADAHEDTRALYRECLSGDGYEIEEAEDGRVALAKALSRRPVLVITEVTLPFVDGYELCQLLRRDPVTADVPILIVTAEQRPREVDRARAVAADALLVKPIAPAALLNEVRRLMSQAEESRGASHDAAVSVVRQPSRLSGTGPASCAASRNRGSGAIGAHIYLAATLKFEK